ncbi:MAG TPA: hypothetical protein VLN59_11890 [Burkholderiales bacterium]|nr:hypothetical protein [Burkholderiales bacterium]
MMTDSIDTAGREQRIGEKPHDAAAGISEEELSVALRAAGASTEDVRRYLDMDAKRPASNR